ncbi:uncharacterized protein LOC143852027 isoform X2 [Tasmannia lanceolata]|uniref:uncharacterized protein LOC143852027 isoform X2 n=1 Tax=Tasmannia lanceolata TaxID=3420 RepID=UPI004063855B
MEMKAESTPLLILKQDQLPSYCKMLSDLIKRQKNVLRVDPTRRLRWTTELHHQFLDSVTRLGGPHKATPKAIMRTMGVMGLTLFHLKSHLQKYRLGMKSSKDPSEKSKYAYYLSAAQGNNSSTPPGVLTPDMNEDYGVEEALRGQMEGHTKWHEQLEMHVEAVITVQKRYLNLLLEKAIELLSKEIVEATHKELSEPDTKEVVPYPHDPSISSNFHQFPVETIRVQVPPNQSHNRDCYFTKSYLTSNGSPTRFSSQTFRSIGNKRSRIECASDSIFLGKADKINAGHGNLHAHFNFPNTFGSNERNGIEAHMNGATLPNLSQDARANATADVFWKLDCSVGPI